jgi:hypothetical protein
MTREHHRPTCKNLCYFRLTDDADRMWLLSYIKDVTTSRLGTDFDDAFRALLPTRHATAGLEDLRRIFFTDLMDTAAEEPQQRRYDEAQVLSLLVHVLLIQQCVKKCIVLQYKSLTSSHYVISLYCSVR